MSVSGHKMIMMKTNLNKEDEEEADEEVDEEVDKDDAEDQRAREEQDVGQGAHHDKEDDEIMMKNEKNKYDTEEENAEEEQDDEQDVGPWAQCNKTHSKNIAYIPAIKTTQ
ncbi:hypothetical protein SUGI_0533990 [Cryptomeria japonica]|nr:hypothetical protein SUGI_0533990 [Cryptomeria japonica]